MTKNGRFELPLRTARLTFEGEYEGAEMVCRLDVPLSLYFALSKLTGSQDVELVEQGLRMFGDQVVTETNISIAGVAVTPDGDGLMQLPLSFLLRVFEAWSGAMGGEAAIPLGGKSS